MTQVRIIPAHCFRPPIECNFTRNKTITERIEMNIFKFALNDRVKLSESEEKGTVIGRAEYVHCESNYLIRYRAGDGRLIESWWTESAIEPVVA